MSLYSAAVIADMPAVYYRLGEASGTTAVDSSGNGNDGTYSPDSPPDITLGQTGAISADPDTAVAFIRLGGGNATNGLTGPAALDSYPSGRTTISLECWIKTSDVTNTQVAIGWLSKTFNISAVSGVWGFTYAAGATTVTVPIASVGDGAYHHVVCVFDSGAGSAKVYVDGVLTASAVVSAAMPVGSYSSFFMGRRLAPFTGTLDEAAVYPTALTLTQIQAHYNIGHPSVASVGTGARNWFSMSDE